MESCSRAPPDGCFRHRVTTVLVSKTMRRVLIGCIAAVVFATGGVVVAQRAPTSPPHLPRVSAAALIASALRALAVGRPVSGSLSAAIDIGIPDVIDVGSLGPSGGALSLLTGTHTMKVWRSADGLRISVIEPTGERALFVSRGHAWAWDFDSLTAYDLGTIPPLSAFLFGALGGGGPGTENILRRGLASASDTTHVAVQGTTSVADRSAYRLVVTPSQPGTLVGAVEIDVDAATRLPLAFAVYPRGAKDAAFSLRFTSVRFNPIDPSTFDFTPPPGIRVRHVGSGGSGIGGLLKGVGGVRTFGRAWRTVFALRVPPVARSALGGVLAGSFLRFAGSLFSVRAVNDRGQSWLLLGAVPMSRLNDVLGRLP